MIKTAKFILPLVILSLSMSGCGGGGKRPSTVKITGVLKIGGAAAGEGISVTLSPKSPDSGLQSASATTAADGKITFFTGQTATDGVMPGKYVVVVVDTSSDSADYMDADKMDEGTDGQSTGPKSSGKIPERFGNNKTSDYEVTIEKADSNFEINIPAE